MTPKNTTNTLLPIPIEYRQHSPHNRCPWCNAPLRLYVQTDTHVLRVVQCSTCHFISTPPLNQSPQETQNP